MAKIYNALLLNCFEPIFEKILWKNQNIFQRNQSTTSQILTIWQILEGVHAKNLEVTLLFVDFSKAFDSIHRGNMEQILIAYGPSKETVAVIIMLYKNTKVKVSSPDGDTDFFDIVAGVLQGDTLICLDYMLWMLINLMKENGFTLKRQEDDTPHKLLWMWTMLLT